MSVYAGIDVHRKRSQIAVLDEEGTVRINRNVPGGVTPVLEVIGDLPIGTPVAFEAAYGWGWLVEMLEDCGYQPHLVHPLRCKAIASARLKNDKADAATLGRLLRADLLPEAWIAPLDVHQQRALLRHRFQPVRLRTLLRNRVHAALADGAMPGPAGSAPAPGGPGSPHSTSRTPPAGRWTTCCSSWTPSRSRSTRRTRNWPRTPAATPASGPSPRCPGSAPSPHW
jgi:hypothetical protein